MKDDITDTIGPYHVIEKIGEGGYGELVLAQGPDEQKVIVKILKLDHILDEKSLTLFEREAGVLKSVNHKAVPRFIDNGVSDDGSPYLVQEFIKGPTLSAAVENGRRFDSKQAEQLARDLLNAIQYLHELHPPVIHRDIKPSNIVLAESGPVIIDFGAACGKAVLKGETTDTVVGTFGYMAPEMLKGHVSPASDLYSLGATLLYAFSGREPESFPTKRLRIEFRETLKLPEPMATLLEQLIEPAAEDRPQTADEAIAVLDKKASDQPTGDLIKREPEKEEVEQAAEGSKKVKKTSWKREVAKYSAIAAALGIGFAMVTMGIGGFLVALKTVAIWAVIIVVVVLVLFTFVGGC